MPPGKVTVTHNGYEAYFSPQIATPDEAKTIRQKFKITGEYLLAVGSVQPRKNLVRLLRAYATLREQHAEFQLQLVIVGRKLWLYQEILREIQQQKFAPDVIVTDYVSDKDLPALYRSATALVYPSLFEGFGLPPLEAMACGTPVITSNTSSLPEVVADAAILVDPYNENDIAGAMLKIAFDEQLKLQLREQGIVRARHFTWRAAAEKTLAIYRSIHQST